MEIKFVRDIAKPKGKVGQPKLSTLNFNSTEDKIPIQRSKQN